MGQTGQNRCLLHQKNALFDAFRACPHLLICTLIKGVDVPQTQYWQGLQGADIMPRHPAPHHLREKMLILAIARDHKHLSATLVCDTKGGNFGVLCEYNGSPSFAALKAAVQAWGDCANLSCQNFNRFRGPFTTEYGTYGLVLTEDLAEVAYDAPLTAAPHHLLPLPITRFRADVATYDHLNRQSHIEVAHRASYKVALNTLAQCLADGRLKGARLGALASAINGVDLGAVDVFSRLEPNVLAFAIACHTLATHQGFALSQKETQRLIKALGEISENVKARSKHPTEWTTR